MSTVIENKKSSKDMRKYKSIAVDSDIINNKMIEMKKKVKEKKKKL